MSVSYFLYNWFFLAAFNIMLLPISFSDNVKYILSKKKEKSRIVWIFSEPHITKIHCSFGILMAIFQSQTSPRRKFVLFHGIHEGWRMDWSKWWLTIIWRSSSIFQEIMDMLISLVKLLMLSVKSSIDYKN